MASTVSSVDEIIESFPHSSVGKIEGKLDYKSLVNIKRLLSENAASIHSNQGGGNLGYMQLVVGNTVLLQYCQPPGQIISTQEQHQSFLAMPEL